MKRDIAGVDASRRMRTGLVEDVPRKTWATGFGRRRVLSSGRFRRDGGAGEQGSVLISVLVVVMLVSIVSITLMFQVKVEITAAEASTGYEQALDAAMSGVYEAMRVASEAKPGSQSWRDNPGDFRERFVCSDGADRWYFTVFSAADPESSDLVRYGLTDESSKLNLNAATEEMLGKLPTMTPSLAQTLMDYLDSDDTPRPEGAEQEYYDALPNPYTIRNGPLYSVEELLLVRGFTPSLVYGEDANLNFCLDPNEDDEEILFPPDNKDGRLDLGLRQYVTVCSYDPNQDNTGVPRLDLNNPATDLSGADLPEPLLKYLLAMRTNKVILAHPAELLEAKSKFKNERGQEVTLESGVGKAELPALLDRFTATDEAQESGLLNINTVSTQVLQTVPDIDEALASTIVSTRTSVSEDRRATIAWLFEEGLVDAELFKKIAPYLSARSCQFSFHVVGFGVPSGRFRVLDVIIDTGGGKPCIYYLRDITRLGLPFKIETATDLTPS